MIPPLSIAAQLHALYTRSADSFHRLVTQSTPPAIPPATGPAPPATLDTTAFAPVGDALEGGLQQLFGQLDADPAVQQALRDHTGPDGPDLAGLLRSGAAGAAEFTGSFGLRSVVAGALPHNPWAQSLSWFVAAAATVPLGAGTRRLIGVPEAADPGGLLDATLPSMVFLGVNLLHAFGRHTRYPGGTLAGVAQALGLSALTGLAVGAGRHALVAPGAGTPATPQPVSEAMLQRALLMTPVAAMSLYVFSRSQRGLPLRRVDQLGPLLLLSVVWCLRNHRLAGGPQD